MIRTAAPHALRTAKTDRHAYQTEVIDIIAKVIADIEQQRSAAVAEVEANLSSFESSKATTVSALDTSIQEVQRKKNVTAEATASLKAATDAVKNAKAVLQTAKENEDSLTGEHAANVGKRQEYLDVMTDTWEPLKSGTFGGQQWRERNRALGVLLQAMTPLNFEESLSDALPVALKTKVDARGKFALLVIEQVETAMTSFINDLTEKVANVDAVSAERSKAVMAAQASLEVAQDKEKTVIEELVIAENHLAEEETRQQELEKEIQNFGSRQQALAELLEQKKSSLSSALEAGKKFEFLREDVALPTGVDCAQLAASTAE
jgi:DNA repair ATPase RecN